MSSKSLVSVIVTAYNRKQYLPHALRSLEMQTLPRDRFEVIVVKNFEDKESDEIIRRNGWKEVYSDEEWQGPFVLAGLEEAKGDIITFLDDDDMYREDRLSYIYRAFASSRDVVYFHNEQVIINEEGKVISDKSPLPAVKAQRDFVLSSSLLSKVEDRLGICYYQLLPLLREFGPYFDFNSSSIAVRREVIDKEKLKPLEVGIDNMLFALALRLGDERSLLYLTGVPLTYYRVHGNSFSAKAYGKIKASHFKDLRLVEKVMSLLKSNRAASRVAGELPEGCKCNNYELFAAYLRLEALYLPTRLARELSQSLVLRPSEILRFLRCDLVNSALSQERSATSLVMHEAWSLMYMTLSYVLAFIDRVAPRSSEVPLRLRGRLRR
ncbi:glycosyltransferase family 2 protein [Acidilobus saccharovorans]|uniref:glycosyltransferase family 2 protein n=1 Tax=Acidilobus saccharovorans TaxID=242703 RepID=UPI000662965F|nr:glycosyltransferase family 2 protein [Acidilobus saccharovorans]